MAIDEELFLEIREVTGKDYEYYALSNGKVMIRNITQILEDLVDAKKEE